MPAKQPLPSSKQQAERLDHRTPVGHPSTPKQSQPWPTGSRAFRAARTAALTPVGSSFSAGSAGSAGPSASPARVVSTPPQASRGPTANNFVRPDAASDAVYHLSVPIRQISVLLVALIVIMGAALFVVTRGDDDSTATTTTTTTSSTTTTIDDGNTGTGSDAVDSTDDAATVTIPAECVSRTETTTTTAAGDTRNGASLESTTTTTTTTGATTPNSGSTVTTLAPTLGANSSISTVGLDTVSFGLTVKQAEVAAGTALIPCSPVSSCYRVAPAIAPEGISFVVDSGTIERVDITSGPITTRSGLGVGTDEAFIVESLGDKLDRRVNDDGSISLIFVPTDPGDADFRIIFTIRDGVVDSFRSGRIPLVLNEDPCAA